MQTQTRTIESKFFAALSKRFDEGVGSFLESFESVAQKHDHRRQKIKKDEETESQKPAPEYRIAFSEKPIALTEDEYELLYIEVLYTIKHKIGITTSKHIGGENDLYMYAQEAFGITNTEHNRLLAKASEEKAPILILNIEIVEAKELEAKDANGFSDPYCMLGIVPEERKFVQNGGGSSDEEGGSTTTDGTAERKPGFMKRLKSFRKSTTRRREGREKGVPPVAGALRDKLPAKYIQTTDVKKATLNPIWMEKFRFNIASGKTETFHLDIWDHDDEFSVFEAARKLNQVHGFKGLNRYFKQIAQSARTNRADGSTVDDFLGSVNLKLNEIPSVGIDRWFQLEGRSENSKVRGQIHLCANLATREDRGIPEEDNWTDIKQHVELLQIFIDHEIIKFKGKPMDWNGELSRNAETILHQHAIQGDITMIQTHMCRWIAYSKKHLERTLTYKLLLTIIEQLENVWQPTSLSRDEIDMLREAFTLFINHCFKQLARHRELFPAANKIAVEKLEQLLTIISKLYNMEVFRYCCPFQNSLQHEVSTIIKSDEDTLHCASELCYVVIADAHAAVKYYNPIFETTVKLAYYHIAFKKIDAKLMDIILKALEEELGEQIHRPSEQLITEPDSADVIQFAAAAEQTGLSLFELYLSLHELVKYKIYVNETGRPNLKTSHYYVYFGAAMRKWLSIARNKVIYRIEKSVELDKPESITQFTKFTSSSLDVSNCCSQIAQFWRRLAWPDIVGSIPYLIKITEDMGQATVLYANLVEGKLQARGYYEAVSIFLYTQDLSVTINNIERVRESFKTLPIELSYDKLLVAAEKYHNINVVEENRRKIETIVATCSQEIAEKIYKILHKVVQIMENELKQHVFHMIEAPEAVQAQETMAPLIQYLDNNLLAFKDYMIRHNFTRLLEIVWTVILEQILVDVQTASSRPVSCYQRLLKSLDTSLIDFFHADDQGLPKDNLKNDKYKLVKRLVKYQSTDTCTLIKMYYQDKLQEQERTTTNDLGKIYCRAYYHTKEETLCIEVISCKNLKPCDSNGLSDPFVEIQLCPYYMFSNFSKQSTTIIKKTLNPVFNEKIEFRISKKECTAQGAVIQFIIMDHDLMWSNDFEGEAFMEIANLPGVKSELGDRGFEDLKEIEIPLTHPKVMRSRIIEILELRTSDKIAMDFVRKRREAENL
ncbi:unnamed protein product [Didymodactylos carnosus]|uniref:BAI1-associated protein 3 n=1 Tax=Didymodactylos carnosus TaxID=1234261 RepID=A0A8S2CUH0_9BILA|nr:unnamed protein product [Didymodactylos carnosus]CAF3544737.1 unnamed protein product [Didymodactylos carnosus]